MKYIFLMALAASSMVASAQNKPDKELKMSLNDDGSHYLKATFTAQVWLRYTDMNPGSTVGGFSEPTAFDIGLRRVRAQLYGKVTDKVFLYTQAGINSFAYNGARKPGMFFHDVVTEYAITPRVFQVGAGLTGWNGLMRYSSPSIASILAYDAPLYQQTTNDVNDQFLRKLSVYGKGKIGKIDYRLILSKPMMVDGTITTVKPIGVNADFAYTPTKLQTAAYVMYQFLEEESNVLPYMTGTYLGKKKVFNIGAGYQYQPDAVWHYGDAVLKDTIKQNMLNYAVDVFLDHPIGSKGAAITAYAAWSHTDYGKNYVRNFAPMNPATAGSGTSFNGGGSAFPAYGTGQTMYGQLGYLLPNSFLGENNGRLQPYADITVSKYDRLNSNVIMWDAGVNWLIDGHRSKMSLNYQNRPIFNSSDLKVTDHKGMVVLQFQIAI